MSDPGCEWREKEWSHFSYTENSHASSCVYIAAFSSFHRHSLSPSTSIHNAGHAERLLSIQAHKDHQWCTQPDGQANWYVSSTSRCSLVVERENEKGKERERGRELNEKKCVQRKNERAKVDGSFYEKKLSIQSGGYIMAILFVTVGDRSITCILSNHELSFLAIPCYTRPYLRHDESNTAGIAFTFEWRNLVPKGCSVNADDNGGVSAPGSG